MSERTNQNLVGLQKTFSPLRWNSQLNTNMSFMEESSAENICMKNIWKSLMDFGNKSCGTTRF